jgi:hypothetical protein
LIKTGIEKSSDGAEPVIVIIVPAGTGCVNHHYRFIDAGTVDKTPGQYAFFILGDGMGAVIDIFSSIVNAGLTCGIFYDTIRVC